MVEILNGLVWREQQSFFLINLSWNLHDKISVNKKVRAQLETADTKLVSKLNLIAPNGNVIATGKTEHLA